MDAKETTGPPEDLRQHKAASSLHSETAKQTRDPLEQSFGAWWRPEHPDEWHRRMRAAFENSMHRQR